MIDLTSIQFPSGRRLEDLKIKFSSMDFCVYEAKEHTIDSTDEFNGPEEIVRTVLVLISNRPNTNTVQNWKDWKTNVKDYYAVDCTEVCEINGCVVASCTPYSGIVTQFPEKEGDKFIAALCDMAIELDKAGFRYKTWKLSNIVQDNNSWRLLPTTDMERVTEPDATKALVSLGRWLMGLTGISFLQAEPVRSIITMMAEGKVPEEILSDITYQNCWTPAQIQGVNLVFTQQIQDERHVRLEWDPNHNEEFVLYCVNKKATFRPNQFIWYENISQYAVELDNVPDISPIIDTEAGFVEWTRPHNNSRYELQNIVPAIRRDNWIQMGTPVIVGGPEEAQLSGAYIVDNTEEVVISPNWSSDSNIQYMYIVARRDRFARNINDNQTDIPIVKISRKQINHPFHQEFSFSSSLYLVVFNSVSIGTRKYYSAGQSNSCRVVLNKKR